MFTHEGRNDRKRGIFIPVRSNYCRNCTNGDQQVVRHRKRGDPDTTAFPYKAWGRAVDACKGRCPACGSRPDILTIDHVVLFSHGGMLTADNLRPLCKPCNSARPKKPHA